MHEFVFTVEYERGADELMDHLVESRRTRTEAWLAPQFVERELAREADRRGQATGTLPDGAVAVSSTRE